MAAGAAALEAGAARLPGRQLESGLEKSLAAWIGCFAVGPVVEACEHEFDGSG